APRLRRAAARLRGLTARCDQAKLSTVPMMPQSRCAKTEIHLHRNPIHKTSDTPSDNGPEFVSRAPLSWIVTQGIGTALIEPGKPWQNGVTDSFNGKFRDECISLEWLRSRAEARVIIESWRQHFNAVRPHSSLGYLTPNEFAAQLTNAAPGKATGRGAAVHGPSRPGPLHHPPRERQMQQTMGAVSS